MNESKEYLYYKRIKKIDLDLQAFFRICRQKNKKKKGRKFRIAFLVQCGGISWCKQRPIYEAMLEDERFEPILLCVPDNLENNKLKTWEGMENITYDYFKKRGYHALNTLIGEDEWLPLEELDLDMVMYLRPYDSTMPRCYTSSEVSKFSRVAILPYAIWTHYEGIEFSLVHDFFRNCSLFLADSKESAAYIKKMFFVSEILGVRKSKYWGNPVISDNYFHMKSEKSLWKEKKTFKIMWTPRWCLDEYNIGRNGGSNFLTYYKLLLKRAVDNLDEEYVFRPHPLTFEWLVRSHKLDSKEIMEYKNEIKNVSNVTLDEEPEFAATMWACDVLITDFSTLLTECFAMDKPIIFCTTPWSLKCNYIESVKKILSVCYVSHCVEDTIHYIEMIKTGNDYKKSKRKSIIKELFGDKIQDIPKDIVDKIYKVL